MSGVGARPASFGTCIDLISTFLDSGDFKFAVKNQPVGLTSAASWRLTLSPGELLLYESSATTSKLKKATTIAKMQDDFIYHIPLACFGDEGGESGISMSGCFC